MITKAKVVLQHGRTFTSEMDVSDIYGIEVGKSYMLNLDGTGTKEWKVSKIVRDYAQAEPRLHD